MRTRSPDLFAAFLASVVWPLVCAPALAQLDLLDLKGASPAGVDADSLVKVSASFNVEKDGRKGRLVITAEVADEWHIYSITQAAGGPIATQIKLGRSSDYKVTGDFKASPAPK